MKSLLEKIKNIFKINIINKWKSILFPDYSKYIQQNYTERTLFKQGLSSFLYAIVSYTTFYFIVFLLGYNYYSEINNRMQEEFILKGNSYISYFFNSYPFNIVYVIALLIIFILFCSSFVYLIVKLIEEVKISFLTLISVVLSMTVWWVFSLFFFLILNTSFPFNQPTSVVYFGFLIAFWIILLSVGMFFSSRLFVNLLNNLLNVNRKRSYFAIYTAQILFFYFIFSIIT